MTINTFYHRYSVKSLIMAVRIQLPKQITLIKIMLNLKVPSKYSIRNKNIMLHLESTTKTRERTITTTLIVKVYN
jgi:hypothetical protein